jgi:hypothetical protein
MKLTRKERNAIGIMVLAICTALIGYAFSRMGIDPTPIQNAIDQIDLNESPTTTGE